MSFSQKDMQLVALDEARQALQARLLQHPISSRITDLPQLRLFMESHVFAVWDFMSLGKRLQRELSCISVPWIPSLDAVSTRLINEIILGEESDETPLGSYASHFEIYCKAMQEVAASTTQIESFITALREGVSYTEALQELQVPAYVQNFVSTTLKVSIDGSLEENLAFFLYGREDFVPKMFQALLHNWQISPTQAPMLHYYLQRHISLDGDQHGPMCQQMLERNLNAQLERRILVMQAACHALQARLELWDGLLQDMQYLENENPKTR